jgi:amino acid adenylation domain-containing protein
MHPTSTETDLSPEQCLAWGRGVRTTYPAQATLPEIFAHWVAKTPEAPAVRDGTVVWSYSELAKHAGAAAAALQQLDAVPGSFIALPARRSAGFVAAALGVLQAGYAYLPLDEEEPEERQAMRRRDAAAILRWSEGPEPRFTLEKLAPSVSPLASLAGSASPAYLLYTSGSTGRPKGVVVPHRAIARLVCATDYLDLRPDDVVAFHSNLSFDASTLELWGPLLNGASLVVTATETVLSADALAEHLRAYGITTLWLTTSLFAQLAQERPAMFAGLRNVLFGGEAANAAAVRLVCEHGRPENLINGYGPTESTTFAVCHRVEGPVEDRLPIGRPIANTDAFVLDEQQQPAVEGELYLGGDGLALGYHAAPELTCERFLETPLGRLYRTGDLARWRPDGTLDYLGRRDRQVKLRGFRIEPGEIEAALRAVPGVKHAAVVLTRDLGGDPCLAAYFVGDLAAESVRRALRERLPAAFVPAAVLPVERLPLTANGKLDEAALPPPFAARAAAARPPGASPLQDQIVAAWEEVLGPGHVALDENFFDLGGTSLSLLRVYRRLRELPACARLREVDLFRHPTVRGLARFLEEGRGTSGVTMAQARAEKQREAMARRRLLSKR